MNDDQLIRALRGLDRPVTVNPAFGEELYAVLLQEHRRRRRAGPSRSLLLAAALLLLALSVAVLLAAGAALREPRASLVVTEPWTGDGVAAPLPVLLHPELMPDLSWTVTGGEWGRTFTASVGAPGRVANLIVEQPPYVFEDWGRRRVVTPVDLVAWLTNHPSLDVERIAGTTVAGRAGSLLDVRPVYPVPSPMHQVHAHYWNLTPYLRFDGSWRYGMLIVPSAAGRWVIATCEAPGEWWDLARGACGDLLTTWEWLEAEEGAAR